ncbi:hypothetical protein OXT66_04980 [Lentilactobacillus senioris]|uniref:hypothetical protein n=1 Tax=Lentilactobacillus senioris TaxID=931534 RepID=UPI00227FA0DB|nr:hypothetical protein [Lentilactobacillus senioris]MCY9806903.1 hypothetical protein [Lentilactobacillus senioris]
MQNKSNNSLYSFTRGARQKYHQLFAPTFTRLNLKQMPSFQLRLFLKQATNQRLLIQMDFNSGGESVIGNVSQLNNECYLITTQNQRFTRIAQLTDIKAVQRI